MTVIPFSRWSHSLVCTSCEIGEPCLCSEDMKTNLWRLAGTTGIVEQFLSDGPFYGTWASGRTGAMTTLDSCKERVEQVVRHG